LQTLGAFREPRQGASRCIQVASQATLATNTLTDSMICKSFTELLIASKVSEGVSVIQALLNSPLKTTAFNTLMNVQ